VHKVLTYRFERWDVFGIFESINRVAMPEFMGRVIKQATNTLAGTRNANKLEKIWVIRDIRG
jgi:hypothetical protein